LGVLYLNGKIVPRSYNKSIYYFQKACRLGGKHACDNIAVMYLRGVGVELNLIKASMFFKKACELRSKMGCEFYNRLNP
jgi:hypothetical protein